MMAFHVPLLDPILGHALAGTVALVLVVGATQKIRDWPSFRRAVGVYRLLPEALVTPAALALPALELIAGVALIIISYRSAAALLAVAVLATVTGASGTELISRTFQTTASLSNPSNADVYVLMLSFRYTFQ